VNLQPQNPYDPSGWAVGVEIDFVDQFTPIVNTQELLLSPDPLRIWFCVIGYGSIGDWGIWTRKLPSVGGIKQTPGTGYVLIHNASYPSAVQLAGYLHMGATSGPMQVTIGRSNTVRG
jgi:hypothetical protein